MQTVVATGNFDGLHLGHRRIFEEVIRLAQTKNLKPLILSFEPHTRHVLQSQGNPMLLTPFLEKAAIFKDLGIGYEILPFNSEIASLDAQKYVELVILQQSQAAIWVFGQNHRFGRGGLGNLALVQQFFPQIQVIQVESAQCAGEVVSSSRIRELLADGFLDLANQMLGRPYSLAGLVIHGHGRGREIGFPTANLKLEPQKMLPKSGVYAGIAQVDGRPYKAVVNVGNRPTFPGAGSSVEVHLIDTFMDLYGKNLEMKLNLSLRGEMRFAQVSALREQIARDVEMARSLVSIE